MEQARQGGACPAKSEWPAGRAPHSGRVWCLLAFFRPGGPTWPPLAYYGLYALQHRGQEARASWKRRRGVLHLPGGGAGGRCSPQRLESLGEGNIVVGHVRYATTGSDPRRNVQPLVINHRKGLMALAQWKPHQFLRATGPAGRSTGLHLPHHHGTRRLSPT